MGLVVRSRGVSFKSAPQTPRVWGAAGPPNAPLSPTLGSSWVLPGFFLGSTWILLGFYLGSTWVLPGFYTGFWIDRKSLILGHTDWNNFRGSWGLAQSLQYAALKDP